MRVGHVVTPCSGVACGHGISLVAASLPRIAPHAETLPVSSRVSSNLSQGWGRARATPERRVAARTAPGSLATTRRLISMASGRSLNWRQQQALVSLIRSRQPALLTIGPTDTIDGQLHINYKTAEALERRELVRVVPHDRSDAKVFLR